MWLIFPLTFALKFLKLFQEWGSKWPVSWRNSFSRTIKCSKRWVPNSYSWSSMCSRIVKFQSRAAMKVCIHRKYTEIEKFSSNFGNRFRKLTSNQSIRWHNFHSLLLLTRCLQYFCDNRLPRYNIIFLKKSIPDLLKAIQHKIENDRERITIYNVIDLATIFARHLAIPNFLFQDLIHKMDSLKVNSYNRLRIRRLVDILCIRLKK